MSTLSAASPPFYFCSDSEDLLFETSQGTYRPTSSTLSADSPPQFFSSDSEGGEDSAQRSFSPPANPIEYCSTYLDSSDEAKDIINTVSSLAFGMEVIDLSDDDVSGLLYCYCCLTLLILRWQVVAH